MKPTSIHTKNCKICNELFETNYITQKICSVECKHENNRIGNRKSDAKKRLTKTQNELVECCLCNNMFGSLTKHLNFIHDMSASEYKELYPDENIINEEMSKDLSERITGENNPGYQHGGTLSSWSTKSTKHTPEQIVASKQKAKNNLTPDKRPTNVEYWIKRGFTKEEAKKKVSERQTTFSLEICIEKYGEEEGRKRFADRQSKWHKSYKKSNYSKISQKLFWEIYNVIKSHEIDNDLFFAEFNCGEKSTVNSEYSLKLTKTSIKPDFFILSKKKIIEFDGDYWHSEKRSALQRDVERDNLIISNGYSVYHVKEKDYKTNPQKVIQECVGFLNG